MLKPWQPCDPWELEAVELDELPHLTRDLLLGHTIEFISLGLVPAGDFQLRSGDETRTVRAFQTSDGAVLGWISDSDTATGVVGFASLLQDGTCVKSTPGDPSAPWSCCRFPVYVNFGAGCGLEDLLVVHLTSLAELEHGCGPTLKYAPSQVTQVIEYMLALQHETEYGLGAPPEAVPEVPEPCDQELITH